MRISGPSPIAIIVPWRDGRWKAWRRSRSRRTTSIDPAAFAKRVHLLWLGVGTEEPANMHAGIERLHMSLMDANIKHVFYESPGTAHEWQTWRRDLKDFAPRLFQGGSSKP